MSTTEINTQRSIHRAQFQLYLDHCMMSKAPAFKSSEMGHCAATYWQHWRTTVEEAFTGFVEMDDVPRGYDRRAYLGHGIIKVKEVDVHGSPRVNFKRGSATPSSAPAAVRTLTQQCTRLRQWADRVMVQRRGAATPQQITTFEGLNARAAQAILHKIQYSEITTDGASADFKFEADLSALLAQPTAHTNIGFAFSLRKYANIYERLYDKQLRTGAANTNKAKVTQAMQDTNLQMAYKQMRTATAPPLQHTTIKRRHQNALRHNAC
jgi:hypothetical protein